jgi:hypothetical protein
MLHISNILEVKNHNLHLGGTVEYNKRALYLSMKYLPSHLNA